MSAESSAEVRDQPRPVNIAEFLEEVSPGTEIPIADLTKMDKTTSGREYATRRFNAPEIQLHCSDDLCNGMRFFRETTGEYIELFDGKWEFFYVTYRCSNCRKTEKTFALAAKKIKDVTLGLCYKLGEMPSYGPPASSRLIKLIGPDRETFLKGRRCENQGLGVGAFAYYRRVVENQKNRILERIIEVAKKVGAADSDIEALEAAKAEIQFKKALKSVRDSIPQVLLINGQNPLTLLHSALSEGLHDRADEECLQLANSIRIVLSELSDRLSQALKDEAELNRAVAHLMNSKGRQTQDNVELDRVTMSD